MSKYAWEQADQRRMPPPSCSATGSANSFTSRYHTQKMLSSQTTIDEDDKNDEDDGLDYEPKLPMGNDSKMEYDNDDLDIPR